MTEAIILWKASPSKEVVLCCLLEHFTLHWEAIKTITGSLVKVIIFFKIQKHLSQNDLSQPFSERWLLQ